MVTSSISQQFIDRTEMDKVELGSEKVILFQPYETEQILLAENASCLAVKTYLKMLKIDYEVKVIPNAEFICRNGKHTHLPVVKIGAFLVSEFEPIINLMEHKKLSLTEKLEQEDKEELITYMSLVESIMTNAEQYIYWMDEKVRNEITYKRNGSVYPFPLNHVQNYRKKQAVMKKLRFYEWDKLTMEEVIEKVDKLCNTLSVKLGNQGYFFKIHTELDALVFGHLFCIFTMELPITFAETINKYQNLTEFCQRIEKLYFGKIQM